LKFNLFLLINDYSKIFQKLKSSDRSIVIQRELRRVHLELDGAKDPGAKKPLLQKSDELHKELKVLSRKDSYSAAFPVSAIVKFMIGLFGFFIVISLFIGFRMVRVITSSVNELTKGTEKIRKGDFSFRIKIKSRDQMHELAESFNEMASGIGRLLIEEKVRERLEEELRIARTIQLKLLPPENFSCSQFEIAAINIPAQEIAGDYFDYFYEKDEFLSVLRRPWLDPEFHRAAQKLAEYCDVPQPARPGQPPYRRITRDEALSVISGLHQQGVKIQAVMEQVDAWPYSNIALDWFSDPERNAALVCQAMEDAQVAGDLDEMGRFRAHRDFIFALARLVPPGARLWLSGWLEATTYAAMQSPF